MGEAKAQQIHQPDLQQGQQHPAGQENPQVAPGAGLVFLLEGHQQQDGVDQGQDQRHGQRAQDGQRVLDQRILPQHQQVQPQGQPYQDTDLLPGVQHRGRVRLGPGHLAEGGQQYRRQANAQHRAGQQAQGVGGIVQGGELRKEMHVRVDPVHGEGDQENQQDKADLAVGQAGTPAQRELIEQPQQGAQVHARAAGAQRQGPVAQVERAGLDAVADGVADGVHLAQQAGGRLHQPEEEQGQPEGGNQDFEYPLPAFGHGPDYIPSPALNNWDNKY